MIIGFGLGLSIFAALLFGVYLYVVKRYFATYPAPVYVFLVDGFAFAWYLPVAAFTVEGAYFPGGFRLSTAGVLLGVAFFTGLAILAFFEALKRDDVSYVAPISKIVPVFVLPLEVGLLGQHLTAMQVAGVVVATIAIYVANYKPGELLEPVRRAATTRAAQLALLSAAAFGVVDVGKRFLSQELAVPAQTFVPVLFAVVTLMMVPFVVRLEWPAADIREDIWKFAGAGLLVAFGNHIVMLAFAELPASIVSPVVNMQAIVAVILGGVLLRESAFRIRLVAAALAVLGISMITLGENLALSSLLAMVP